MRKNYVNKLMALTMVGALGLSMVGCGNESASASASSQTTEVSNEEATSAQANNKTTEEVEKAKAPKYVFLFIGDGMSYPQIQIASDYLGALEQEADAEILKGGKTLSFMQFSGIGSATTFDSTSFCPDSASTATSISTGHKTYSSVINMDEGKTVAYETIAEKLKDQLGYKIGVISTVNINHATPAAFYAHQASRNNYYEIGLEMIASEFDYFAGGGLKEVTGKEKDKDDVYELAKTAGYKVVKSGNEASALTAADGKTIIIGEQLADSDSLAYDNDRESNDWSLADYVDKGIEMLDNDAGFFMMVEGGKIDWACHANDAGSTIADTLALDEAVKTALEFYNQHPDEPLTVTVTHILNNKSGINFSSYAHTGLPVGVFAEGVGADQFNGYYDNTDIYNKLAELISIK